jgi:biopolymer transport protein ExbD
MAEVVSAAKASCGRKKLSTRVDLTPMVDLGFLLITFFIFTTSLARPAALKLILPDESPTDKGLKVVDKKALTLILGGNNVVYYYRGIMSNDIGKIKNNATEIRSLLTKVTQEVAQEFGDRKETVVLIKALSTSSYKDVVDVLDEMLINDISKYVLVEPGMEELALIEKSGGE